MLASLAIMPSSIYSTLGGGIQGILYLQYTIVTWRALQTTNSLGELIVFLTRRVEFESRATVSANASISFLT